MKRKYRVVISVPLMVEYVVERDVDGLDLDDWTLVEIVEMVEVGDEWRFHDEWKAALNDGGSRWASSLPDICSVEEIGEN